MLCFCVFVPRKPNCLSSFCVLCFQCCQCLLIASSIFRLLCEQLLASYFNTVVGILSFSLYLDIQCSITVLLACFDLKKPFGWCMRHINKGNKFNEKRYLDSTHRNADCLLKNTSIKHNTHMFILKQDMCIYVSHFFWEAMLNQLFYSVNLSFIVQWSNSCVRCKD